MKTQLSQLNWAVISHQLRLKLNSFGKDAKALSNLTGIKYDAAYRLLKGGLQRQSRPALRLCDYFGINIYDNAMTDTDQLRLELDQVLDQVWDKSEAHAKLIQKLIRSTSSFSIAKK